MAGTSTHERESEGEHPAQGHGLSQPSLESGICHFFQVPFIRGESGHLGTLKRERFERAVNTWGRRSLGIILKVAYTVLKTGLKPRLAFCLIYHVAPTRIQLILQVLIVGTILDTNDAKIKYVT